MIILILSHGSCFSTDLLKPSYYHTGELVTWDVTETNKFLYASMDKEEAIQMSLASHLERKCGATRTKFKDKVISVHSHDVIRKKDFEDLSIYVYEIEIKKEHDWIKVNNRHNGSKTEFKTEKFIPDTDFIKYEVSILEWLSDKKIKFIKEPLSFKIR